jgi:hypothetical protein
MLGEGLKESTVTPKQQHELRDLCQLAMSEQDESRLLNIFLELNEAVEREMRHTRVAISLERAQRSTQ